jgi:hypothetical protein
MSDLDEINKTRIAAGLKPIPVPGGDGPPGEEGGMMVDEDPDVVAQRNYREHVEKEKKDKETR